MKWTLLRSVLRRRTLFGGWIVIGVWLGCGTESSAAVQEAWVSGSKAGDEHNALGWRVAIDGDIVVAGAPADYTYQPQGGSVYVFDAVTGQMLDELVPSQPKRQGIFGVSVAIAGMKAVVGEPMQLPVYGLDGFIEVDDPGSAYVFDVVTGQELFMLTPDDSASLDHFGSQVAASGNFAVITAWGNAHAGESAGAAYVFDITTGQQLRKLTASDAQTGDYFGTAVAIDGDRVVIGATSEFSPNPGPGSAYVFDIHTGEQLYELVTPDIQYLDYYGRSVSASGGIALIGAHGSPFERAGYVDVFDTTTGEHIRRLQPDDIEINDGFGYATLLDGDIAMVGATNHADETGSRGAVYVFNVRTGALLDKITGPYFDTLDSFGFSLARDGSTTVVGVLDYDEENKQNGVIHVYRDIPEPLTITTMAIGLGLLTVRGRDSRRAV